MIPLMVTRFLYWSIFMYVICKRSIINAAACKGAFKQQMPHYTI